MILVVTRDGWMAIFIAVAVAGDVAVLPVLCAIILPVWLLVTGAPEFRIAPPAPKTRNERGARRRELRHMAPVIGDILPLALGVAISPIPIIAAILMLLSPKAKGTSVGFLTGWVLGIVVAVVAFTLLGSIIPEQDPDEAKPIAGVVKILLGCGVAVPRPAAVAQPSDAR